MFLPDWAEQMELGDLYIMFGFDISCSLWALLVSSAHIVLAFGHTNFAMPVWSSVLRRTQLLSLHFCLWFTGRGRIIYCFGFFVSICLGLWGSHDFSLCRGSS